MSPVKPEKSQFNIFISHISLEGIIAQRLKDAIAADFGGQVEFFVSSDLESIALGDKWFATICDALRRADMLFVLCSRESISRPWVNFEAGAAYLKDIPVVPICHSGLQPDELKMPLLAQQGLVLNEPKQLEKLYLSIQKMLHLPYPPKRNFIALARALQGAAKVVAKTQRQDPGPILADRSITKAIDHASLGWTLCFIGEDQSDKAVELARELSLGPSPDGNGKRFPSGFAYWGIGPTLAWDRACTDKKYLVMKWSIQTFEARWTTVKKLLKAPQNYVSLGVGTGEKDRVVLSCILAGNPQAYFFPVDMSGDMLRVGVVECLKNGNLPRSRVLPVQIDFSTAENAHAIWGVVTQVVGDQPVLYSLLGNTLANFDDDSRLLKTLAGLLRDQDRLLLEVAITQTADEAAARTAAHEYQNIPAFFDFATSALENHTNLTANRAWVSYVPHVVKDRFIEVRTVYTNCSGNRLSMRVPTGQFVDVDDRETVRLYLTRKYLSSWIEAMVEDSGCVVDEQVVNWYANTNFGLGLYLISPRTASTAPNER